MKTIILVLILICSGCTSASRIHEDNLYVTKKYVGDFVMLDVGKRETNIITNLESFYIYGNPDLNIQPGARCYVKYSAESKAGTMRKFWILYFTWDGTEDWYMLRQNAYTGEVY